MSRGGNEPPSEPVFPPRARPAPLLTPPPLPSPRRQVQIWFQNKRQRTRPHVVAAAAERPSPRPSAAAARPSRRPSARRPRSTASQETVSTLSARSSSPTSCDDDDDSRPNSPLFGRFAGGDALFGEFDSDEGGHGPNSSTDSMSDDGGAPAALGGADKRRRVDTPPDPLANWYETASDRSGGSPTSGPDADRPFASAPMGYRPPAYGHPYGGAAPFPKAAPPAAAPAPAFPLESVVVPEDQAWVSASSGASVSPTMPGYFAPVLGTPKEKETSARKPIVPFPEKRDATPPAAAPPPPAQASLPRASSLGDINMLNSLTANQWESLEVWLEALEPTAVGPTTSIDVA